MLAGNCLRGPFPRFGGGKPGTWPVARGRPALTGGPGPITIMAGLKAVLARLTRNALEFGSGSRGGEYGLR